MKYQRCKNCKNVYSRECMLCFWGDRYETKDKE